MAIQPLTGGTSDKRKDAQTTQNFQEVRNKLKTNIINDQDGNPTLIVGDSEDAQGQASYDASGNLLMTSGYDKANNQYGQTFYDDAGDPIIFSGLDTANNVYGQQFYRNGVPQMLVGTDGSFTGVKVAQEGKNVLTAGDDELVLSSEFNLLKIVGSGSASLPQVVVTGGAGQYTRNSSNVAVTHNLGYRPVVIAFANNAGTRTAIPESETGVGGTSSAFWGDVRFEVTTTQVIFYNNLLTYNSSVTGAARTINYYLFRETVG